MARGRSFIAPASSLRSHPFRGRSSPSALWAVPSVTRRGAEQCGLPPASCSAAHDPGCAFGSWASNSFAVAATISLYLCFLLVVLRNGPAHPIPSAREPACGDPRRSLRRKSSSLSRPIASERPLAAASCARHRFRRESCRSERQLGLAKLIAFLIAPIERAIFAGAGH
jgi:hypothetical protein